MNIQNLIKNFMGMNNPIINNLFDLAKKGDKNQIEQIARNLCKQKGMDYDKEFNKFMGNFK